MYGLGHGRVWWAVIKWWWHSQAQAPTHDVLIPVTVPITVSHSQEDQQEDQEEEDGSEDPVNHGRGDGDGDVPQTPHPRGSERLAAESSWNVARLRETRIQEFNLF